MATIFPTVLKRVARVGLEVGGCVGVWAYADSLESEAVLQRFDAAGQSKNSRKYMYSIQEKSMFAESISEADMNEFVEQFAPENIRTMPLPAWATLSSDSNVADYKKALATVTPEEEERGLADLSSPGLQKNSPLITMLNLMALKIKNQEDLDKHFSYNFDMMTLGIESLYCSRMTPEETLNMESVKSIAKVGLTAMLLMATRYGIYKDWLSFDKPAIPNVFQSKNVVSVLFFCFLVFSMTMVRKDISDVLSTEPLSTYFADSIVQDDLAASEERGQAG
eukprot:gene31750-38378_t